MSNLFSRIKLQSPLWQGIGAIVSIIALVVSSFIAYDIYKKSNKFSDLTIERGYSFNPIDFGESPSRRIAMSINGEEISNIRVYYYTLTNTGNVPITPNDYIEPITVSVKKPFRILTVEKEWSNRKSIKTAWSKTDDNNFQLKPILLNPNDTFITLVFVSERSVKVAKQGAGSRIEAQPTTSTEATDQNDDHKEKKEIPEPSWTARIVNISDLRVANYQQNRQAETKALGIFYTSFYHAGWSVYRFASLVFFLFIFGLFFGVQFGVLQKNSPSYYISLSTLMGLSVVAGDNLASRINGVNEQPLISNISLFLYLLLIVFFTFPAVRSSMQKKNNSINSP